MRLHHVQLAIPAGGEDVARQLSVDGLGLTEVEKAADHSQTRRQFPAAQRISPPE